MNIPTVARIGPRPVRWIVLMATLLASVALVWPDIADARGRGGGGRMGGGARMGGSSMARSSISGANRSMSRPAPSSRPSAGTRESGSRGQGATGNRGTGDRGPGDRGSLAGEGTRDINIDNSTNIGVGGDRVRDRDMTIGNSGNRGDRIDGDHDGWGGWHDADIDIEGGPGDWEIDVDVDHHHPIAAAAVIATGAAALASAYYYSLPYGCPMVHTYADPYYYCDGIYYAEQMQGDDIVYVIVEPAAQAQPEK
ncbi:hypothetical protein [Agrilutibacter solisilvae]|uniref:Uncharacterized protein n=1 Tax=Agrilutibacter solisilvae TaxID=2763317 RepID=A0A974XZZ3_9GAMM|nr:hypothetical protein [Lysobacter solisilvae]QSX78794.1 hypothetical protein I8J32_002365 [Lysobacter solisilvae]